MYNAKICKCDLNFYRSTDDDSDNEHTNENNDTVYTMQNNVNSTSALGSNISTLQNIVICCNVLHVLWVGFHKLLMSAKSKR